MYFDENEDTFDKLEGFEVGWWNANNHYATGRPGSNKFKACYFLNDEKFDNITLGGNGTNVTGIMINT